MPGTLAHIDTKIVACQLSEGGENDVLWKIGIND